MGRSFVETINSYVAGISQGSLRAFERGATFQDGIGLDYTTDPDKLTALKKLKKDSGTSVTDLVKWIIEYKGTFYMYGDTGKIYYRNGSGTYSNPITVSNSTGQGIGVFNNELWYISKNQIGKTKNLSTGSPTFQNDYFKSLSSEGNLSNFPVVGVNTYTTPVAISEAAANKYNFTPTVSYIVGVTVRVETKGTGNITCTMHDSSNKIIAQKTFLNSELPAGNVSLRINFDGTPKITSGATYHLHFTSTVADAQLSTSAVNDLTTLYVTTLQLYNDFDIDVSNKIEDRYDLGDSYQYTIKTGISELETDRLSYVPKTNRVAGISFLIFTKTDGTSYTVDLHNDFDEVIATKTLTMASIVERTVYNKFEFTTPATVIPGANYHFHIYKSNGTIGAIKSTTAQDINTAGYIVHSVVLNDDNNYHMTKEFTNLMCIGNGNFLATIDDSEVFNRQRLQFPPDENVRCLEVIGDYLFISTWKNDDITSYGRSRIYFWDGVSDTYNGFVAIDGQVNAMINTGNNNLLLFHGTTGMISTYNGGITELKRLKGIGENLTVEILPGAVATWEGLTYFGIGGGTSTSIDRLAYSYGRKDKDTPYSLNKAYPISTGTLNSTTLKIGAILGVNAAQFFVAWRDNATYGVDIIDTTTDQSSVFVQTLRLDGGAPGQEKLMKSINLRYAPITDTQKITVQWRDNNTGAFTTLGTVDGTSSADLSTLYKSFTSSAFLEYFYEREIKILLETQGGGTDAPTLLQVTYPIEVKDQVQLNRKS